ncbi:MAG: hypothetical protein K0R10_155 [Alphaproteobacteria bacterium]|jgi:hypothetical protein|nr:hypothetical protein [Alphaproteobacteria bacterium]
MKKKHSKPLREQIAALAIIRALEEHILGQNKMSATQVTAALALLRKRLPDLLKKTLNSPRSAKKKPDAAHEDALKDLE